MKTKKVRILAAVVAAVMVTGMLAGCSGSTEEKKETKPVSESALKFSERDLKGVVEGLDGHYILEGAKGIDYMHEVKYDKKEGIVRDIKADTSKVKLDKPGTYEVTYTVTADAEALKAHIEAVKKEKAEVKDESKAENKAEDKAEGKAEDKAMEKKESSGNDVDIEVKKDMEVVDEKKAEELAGKGEDVWTDNNEVIPKAEEKADDAQTGEATEDTGTQKADSEQKAESKTEGNNSSAKAPAQPSTPSASTAPAQSSTPSTPSKPAQQQPAHTHTWVTVEATGHYEEQVVQAAWDEPQYGGAYVCNKCDFYTTNGTAMAAHSCEYNHNYRTDEVQIGTIHHPAVTQSVWVQDSAAYQRCSGCGATR